ncbi:MAG: hypothetical protein ACRD0W_08320 [Acidimicrobiales bacterium]
MTTVVVTRAEHERRVEADRALVEGPVAVEIGCDHGDVADAGGLDHRRPPWVRARHIAEARNGCQSAPARAKAASQRWVVEGSVRWCCGVFMP